MFVSKGLSLSSRILLLCRTNRVNIFSITSALSSSASSSSSSSSSSTTFEHPSQSAIPSFERKFNINEYDKLSRIALSAYELSHAVASGDITLQKLETDKNFIYTCEVIIENVSELSSNKLIRVLQSFLLMGYDPSSSVVRHLENEVLWRCRNLPFKLILKCLSYHHRHQETQQQKQVVSELILYCQSRLDEANNVNDIIQMLRLSHCFSNDCISRIEEMALTLITRHTSEFDFDSLSYLLVLLSQAKRRPTPLIRAAVNKLIEYPDNEIQTPPAHIISMICALNSLNFPDNNLLQKMSDILCANNFMSKVPSSSKKDLLVAVSQLHWRHSKLMDAYIQNIVDNSKSITVQDIIAYVISSALLYYRSSTFNEIFVNHLIPKITRKSVNSDIQWLNIVWSFAILGCATHEHIESVINDKFCNNILKDLDQITANLIELKLLNIKGYAEIELNMKVEFPSSLKSDTEMPKETSDMELFENSLIDSLSAFLPKGKYMATHLMTPFGFEIGAEFIINSSIKPLSLTEYGIIGGDLSKSSFLTAHKSLPHEFKRIALLIMGFNDCLINDSGLIGVNEFAIRMLEKMGYNVVIVHESDISCKTSAIKKIQYLQTVLSQTLKAN